MTARADLPAGGYSAWLREMRDARLTEGPAEVPCGECTACCKSSYFIHVEPDEVETLARIPDALLFPAPGLPEGHVVLGYDENGHCPMLVDEECSIYEDRPRTCRSYDCRVFPAAGVSPGDDGKVLLTERVRRWEFSHPDARDREQHAAVRAAAAFLRERADCFPAGVVPSNETQLAVLALEVYEVFLEGPGPSREAAEIVKAVVAAKQEFDARRVAR